MCLLKLYKRTLFVRNNCILILCVILQTTTENKMRVTSNFIIIVLIGMSASIQGKCLNDKPTTMANAFLISKWKLYYKALDVNHDGKVSMEDAEESKNRFSELEHLNAEREKVVKIGFTRYWDGCIFEGKNGDISEHEFVNRLNIDFNADKDDFVKGFSKCFKHIFSAIDINGNDLISKNELQIAHAAFGQHKIANDNGYFSAYKQNDGLIPLHVIVSTWVDFVTSTDESKGNVVKSGFEADHFE